MKIKKLASVFACAAALCMAQTASAATMLGTIDPGLQPTVANETAFVQFLLDMEFTGNPTTTTGLPTAPGGGLQTYTKFIDLSGTVSTGVKTNEEDPGFNPALPAGFEFVLGKYGSGSTGNISVVWWLDGGAFSVPNTVTLNGKTSGGLSHYTTFGGTTTQVPDGGMTLALLGLSLAGVGYMRRKLA